MPPEGCCVIPSNLEEEVRGDRFDRLDEMLADETPADDKFRACTNPSLWTRAISVIKVIVLISLSVEFPLSFKCLPPCRQLPKASDYTARLLEFPVICWSQFLDKCMHQ